MSEFIEGCFSWPSYPATVLLLLVCGYWVLVMIGAVDMEILDFDLDVDADASILQFGFIPLKFLNLGSVPTMLWVSVFALVGWVLSRLLDSPAPHPSFQWAGDTQAILRDFGVAAIATKFVTAPLRGRFDPAEPNRARELIGHTCVITTSEVTDSFGEAEYATDGAPLKLNVRTSDGPLTKGDSAVIVDFTAENNLYFVTRANGGA